VRERYPTVLSTTGAKGDVGHACVVLTASAFALWISVTFDFAVVMILLVDGVCGLATGAVSEWFARGGYVRRVSIDTDTGCPLTWRVVISRAAIGDSMIQQQ
jgi:hypothetical protein